MGLDAIDETPAAAPGVRWFADDLSREAVVTRVHVAPGARVVAGQPLAVVSWLHPTHRVGPPPHRELRAPRAAVVQRVHVRAGDEVGPGWPLVDVSGVDGTAEPEETALPEPPAGSLRLAWAHDGMVVEPTDVARRTLFDLGLIAFAVGVTLLTAWSLFGFARALVVGTGPAGGLWCLLVAPGLAWMVARSAGQRLWQQLLGVRRLRTTADTLILRTWIFERRIGLAEVQDAVPSALGVRLHLPEQVLPVQLPWTDGAQRAWIARGIRHAAGQARALPDLSEAPAVLQDLRDPPSDRRR